jgi:hypothetical protein
MRRIVVLFVILSPIVFSIASSAQSNSCEAQVTCASYSLWGYGTGCFPLFGLSRQPARVLTSQATYLGSPAIPHWGLFTEAPFWSDPSVSFEGCYEEVRP